MIFYLFFFVLCSLHVVRGGNRADWAGSIVGRVKTGSGLVKIGPIFSSQNFNSPARPKNWAGRTKYSFQGKKNRAGRAILGRAKFGQVFFGLII